MRDANKFQAIVIGASAGGVAALNAILPELPKPFAAAVIIVLHLHPQSSGAEMAEYFCRGCRLPVREAQDKEKIAPGVVYLAPANYHLLVENDLSFSLTIDPKVKFSRPSVDILFESAAEAFQHQLIGVILSGASADGAAGLRRIKELEGLALVQLPESAEYPLMPQAALQQCPAATVLPPVEIGRWLAVGQEKTQRTTGSPAQIGEG